MSAILRFYVRSLAKVWSLLSCKRADDREPLELVAASDAWLDDHERSLRFQKMLDSRQPPFATFGGGRRLLGENRR